MPNFPFYPNYYNSYFYNKRKQQLNYELELEQRKVENENNKKQDKQEDIENTKKENNNNNTKRNYKTSTYNSFANINISALLNSDINTPIVEILGIRLYLDDLIIIGLLFFLYKEEVQDEILFGILLLLLLS